MSSNHRANIRIAAYAGAVVVFVVWALCGAIELQPHEAAVHERFGQVVETITRPGFHWRLPQPLGRIVRYSVGRMQEVRLHTGEPEDRISQDDDDAPARLEVQWRPTIENQDFVDGESLTGDAAGVGGLLTDGATRLVVVEAVVYFQVKRDDAGLRERHLCAAPLEATLRKLARRELAMHASTTRLQGAGREQSKESPWEALRRALQVATDAAGLGIEVVRFGIVAVRPPLAVLPADHEVAAARSDAVRSMIEARNGARAELDRIAMVAASETAEARGAAAVRHAQVRGDAARFSGLAAAFAVAPATERQRLYCDVVGGVLAQRPVVLVDSTLAEVVQLRFDGSSRRDDAE